MWKPWKSKKKRRVEAAADQIKDINHYYRVAVNAMLAKDRAEAYEIIIANSKTQNDRDIINYGATMDPDPSVRLRCMKASASNDVLRSGLYDSDISVRRYAYSALKGNIGYDYDVENPEFFLIKGEKTENPDYVEKPAEKKPEKPKSKIQAGAAEWELRPKTRGDISPENKNYLFIHSFDDIEEKEKLADKILDFPYGRQLAVFTAEPALQVFEKLQGTELDMINIYIPVVDERFLKAAGELPFDSKTFFASLQKKGVLVLPVVKDEELKFDFNVCFGELHVITLSGEEGFARLETEIERFIRTEDWAQRELEHAFTKQLFLSYRKKNKEFLRDTMKEIHDSPTGSDAAIWYDDFLIPGVNFQKAIRKKMKDSDAFILMVTPQLGEEGNYVKEVEYPYARDNMNGRIIPIEVTKTDPNDIKDYSDLPKPLKVDDGKGIEESLNSIFGSGGTTDNNSEKEFLMGICFLLGIMVEKDSQRAVKLLTSAKDKDNFDACKQLFMMYNMGYGVQKDGNKAFELRKKQYDLLRNNDSRDPVEIISLMYDILIYEYDGLLVYLGHEHEFDEADKITRDFKNRIDALPKETLTDKLRLWRIEARLMYIDTLRYSQGRSIPFYELDELISELEALDVSDDYNKDRLLAMGIAMRGDFNGAIGNKEIKERDSSKACDLFEALIDKYADNYDIKKLYRATLGNLGEYQMGVWIDTYRYSANNPIASNKEKRDAVKKCEVYQKRAYETFKKAYEVAKQLVEEEPATNNLETLVLIIYYYTQTFDNSIAYQATKYWKEGSETIDKLVKLGNNPSDYARFKRIFDGASLYL